MNKVLKTIGFSLMLMSLVTCESVDVIYDYREKLAEEIAEIDEYLQTNNIDAKVDVSGMRYVVTDEGTGDAFVEGDFLEFSATLRRMDGGTFETQRNGNADYFKIVWYAHLNSIVKDHWWQCFHEAAKYVREDGQITLYVPSVLAVRDQDLNFPGMFRSQFITANLPGNTIFIIETSIQKNN